MTTHCRCHEIAIATSPQAAELAARCLADDQAQPIRDWAELGRLVRAAASAGARRAAGMRGGDVVADEVTP